MLMSFINAKKTNCQTNVITKDPALSDVSMADVSTPHVFINNFSFCSALIIV